MKERKWRKRKRTRSILIWQWNQNFAKVNFRSSHIAKHILVVVVVVDIIIINIESNNTQKPLRSILHSSSFGIIFLLQKWLYHHCALHTYGWFPIIFPYQIPTWIWSEEKCKEKWTKSNCSIAEWRATSLHSFLLFIQFIRPSYSNRICV